MTQQMNAAVGDWLKSNLITIVIVVGGFVLTVWQLKGSVDDLKTQIGSLNTTVNQIQASQIDERLNYKDLTDKIEAHTRDITAINEHLKAVDSAAANLKDTLSTILTNQSLVNQQIQFLSTQKSFIGSANGKR